MSTPDTDSNDFLEPREPQSRILLAMGCVLGLMALVVVIIKWDSRPSGDATGEPTKTASHATQGTLVLDETTTRDWCVRIKNTSPCCPGYPETFRYPATDTGHADRDWCNRIGHKNVGCPRYATWALSRQGMEEACQSQLDWCNRINQINVGCPFHK